MIEEHNRHLINIHIDNILHDTVFNVRRRATSAKARVQRMSAHAKEPVYIRQIIFHTGHVTSDPRWSFDGKFQRRSAHIPKLSTPNSKNSTVPTTALISIA